MKLLNSTAARLVTILLLAEAALLYSSIRQESVPPSPPLAEVPARFGAWTLVQEGVVDQETRQILKADDLLTRVYAAPSHPEGVNLFVAFFRSQRTGKAPHSPKNCLPGSGWAPVVSDQVTIDLGQAAPIRVNRYVVAREDARSLVLYWYQSRDRAVANEFKAKFYTVADAIRYNRSDTALIRVVVPIANNDTAQATQSAQDFVRAFYSTLRRYLPA